MSNKMLRVLLQKVVTRQSSSREKKKERREIQKTVEKKKERLVSRVITRFALTFSSQNILGRIKDKWEPLPAAGRYRMYTPNLLYDFSSDKETAPTYLSLGKLEWERMRREDKKNLST